MNDTVARTLRIRVPAGTWDAYLLIGDANADRWPTYIRSEGKLLAQSNFLLGGQHSWVKITLEGGRDVTSSSAASPTSTGG